MSPRNLDSRYAIDSCTFQLHSWRPFNYNSPKPYPTPNNGVQNKRPCPNDRATATSSFPIDASAIDMSKLSLFDDDHRSAHNMRKSLGLMARKRRRKGSRSVSGRSSDRSGTRRRCCSVGASAAYATTCSDFPVAAGTDSSGEFFVSGDANWASDASEAAAAARNSRRERDTGNGGGGGDRENSGAGFGQAGLLDSQGNESGYGSEPGYRGDAELGYGDDIDEEEDDPRLLFWGEHFGDRDANMEIVGENNTLQKSHHRCRRKKHELRMVVDPLG